MCNSFLEKNENWDKSLKQKMFGTFGQTKPKTFYLPFAGGAASQIISNYIMKLDWI